MTVSSGITQARSYSNCAICKEALPEFKGLKNLTTTWKAGVEYHRTCWYDSLPDFKCETCGATFPPSQTTAYREHWLAAHKPPGEMADVKMYIPDGMVNDQNKEAVLAENNILRQRHLDCLRACAEWLDHIGVQYFISDGTLLGAFREKGKMIDIDIDTDLSIMEEDLEKLLNNAHLLPDGYLIDPISAGVDWSQCVNTPFSGVGAKKFTFCDVRDYSNIVKETQSPETDIYTFRVDEEGFLRNNYAKPNQAVHLRKWKTEWIFPLTKIEFEGQTYSAPNNSLAYLKELYGYIGHNAYWDPETKVYRKLPGAPADIYDV
jgi:hypothetical protein